MWHRQLPALLRSFRVLRLDLRGHGASDSPVGDYTIAQLAGDVLAAVDQAGGGRFSYCGLSLGGMIGQWLGVHHGARLERLVLACTSPRVADPGSFESRRRKVLAEGTQAIAGAAMERFLTSPDHPEADSLRAVLAATSAVGYAGCCAAIRDMDQRDALPRIAVPTLVIGSDRDLSTPWAGHGERIASSIPGAAIAKMDTAHLANLEKPSAFHRALTGFALTPGAGSGHAGLRVRRAALGDALVDQATAGATSLTLEFEDYINRNVWGAIWNRPGLDLRTRRLLVLATAAALGRWEEFRLHIRAGLERELELEDIEEVLLQTAVYAGVPAASTGFEIVRKETTRK
jgi:3-oxoadipate enol-lactonase/4-carboxymuconolactone decarboxylase